LGLAVKLAGDALLATVSTGQATPVIVAQRLRKGSCGSPRGATRLVADALELTPPVWSATSNWAPITTPRGARRAHCGSGL
jgi:hypothetical protein